MSRVVVEAAAGASCREDEFVELRQKKSLSMATLLIHAILGSARKLFGHRATTA